MINESDFNFTMEQARSLLGKSRAAAGEGEGEYRVDLPWRVLEIEAPERSWIDGSGETVTRRDVRVYRFFGYIGSKRGGKRRSGGYFEDVVVDTSYWKHPLVLKLYHGIGPVDRLPRDLRVLPVRPDERVLTRAARVNPNANGRARNAVVVDPEAGVQPKCVWWGAALVTDIVGYEDEERTRPRFDTFPAWVQMTDYQAGLLGKEMNSLRAAPWAPDGWNGVGTPLHVRKIDTGAPGGSLEVTPVKGESEWDMGKEQAPDFISTVAAIRDGLADYLRHRGAEIADWPEPGDNPDGWRSKSPMAVVQWRMADDSPKDPEVLVIAGSDGSDDVPLRPVKRDRQGLTALTKQQLLDSALEEGLEIPARPTREALITLLEANPRP